MTLGSLLPEISISLAPAEESHSEPSSPFSAIHVPVKHDDKEAYRPVHLTPPPTSTRFPKQLSPLRPVESVNEGSGMHRERFEFLLKASRERKAAVPAKKENGLFREIALKTHKNKQIERRALFLSKVLAPPSPTATCTPKTPPESPAIFHYSLPSPGLTSPLSLFESLDKQDVVARKECWVEQVDFKLPSKPTERKQQSQTTPAAVSRSFKPAKSLPSLAQISAHLHSRSVNDAKASRLPAFLSNPRRASPPPTDARPRLITGVGRLNMPVRVVETPKVQVSMLPPVTPTSPLTPKLQVTTLVVPRFTIQTSAQLTEDNVLSLSSREQRAKNMLSTIRKRRVSLDDKPSAPVAEAPEVKRLSALIKRKSAPSDLASARHNIWGAAPVMVGGF